MFLRIFWGKHVENVICRSATLFEPTDEHGVGGGRPGDGTLVAAYGVGLRHGGAVPARVIDEVSVPVHALRARHRGGVERGVRRGGEAERLPLVEHAVVLRTEVHQPGELALALVERKR